jgi:hypothetical protein
LINERDTRGDLWRLLIAKQNAARQEFQRGGRSRQQRSLGLMPAESAILTRPVGWRVFIRIRLIRLRLPMRTGWMVRTATVMCAVQTVRARRFSRACNVNVLVRTGSVLADVRLC